MHKCVVCSNSTARTKHIRPEVIYHTFPSTEFRRNRWLNVYGMESCFNWHRICSDHFLPEHYRPGAKRFLKKNILPLPYPNRKEDGLPLSYTAESTDVETGNNNLLARDQNLIREEQSTVVNNFESPRRSYRKIKLTTTNEDMSYENMPNLQTERFERQIPTVVANDDIQPVIETVEVPVTTPAKDYTLGSGPLCSVKNCYNRYSADLSFFGYPSDFTLRKEWIEKCGLTIDPTQKVKSGVRVCRVHFEDHCFVNTERRNRLRPNAVPSLFLDGDNIEARNIPSSAKRGLIRLKKRSPVKNGFVRTNKNRPSCSSTNYVANINSRQTPLLVYIDSTIRQTKDFEPFCAVPRCITNVIDETEDISLFAATEDSINDWSSILNLNLTLNSIICERHFRPEDILYPTLLVNGADKQIKSLVPSAMPVPTNNVQSATNGMPLDAGQSVTNNMPLDAVQSVTNDMPLDAVQSATNGMPLDAVQSASNARPSETNDAPVLRTYAGHLKRQNTDGQLSAKKNKIDVLDKSKAATNKMFFSKNENKEYTTITNGTPSYNSTCDLDQNSESSTAIPVDLSIVKIEPNDNDSDSQTNLETKTEQLIKPEPVEDNNLLPSSSIDDSLSISLKKLKKISNSSLSITLEPIDSTKISEPSVNLLPKTSAKSSMSITLQPKLQSNLSSTTINGSPSVSLIHSLPSTLSSSVYNISQQSPLQYKLEATSTSKMPYKLSSNTVVHPEIIDKQIIFSKPITLTNTSNSSELSKIKTPVISKCISLARKSHIHSNSDYSKNDSDIIIIDDDIDTEAFIQEDNGFIYEISKSVSLPNSSWKIEHINGRNSTHFYQQDNFGKFMRKISFNNSLFPAIHIHGKKYEYNKPIKTKNELHNLIEKIDGIYKCVGKEGFVSENCTGFCEGNSEGVRQCSSCQKKYEVMHTTKESQFIIKGGLEKIISKKSEHLLELKENIEDDGKSLSPEEEIPFHINLINCMVPRH